MAIKLVRHAGTITVSTMGDDNAHSLDCGLMGKGQALRVNEFGGQEVFALRYNPFDDVAAVAVSVSVTLINTSCPPNSLTLSACPFPIKPQSRL